VSYQEQLVELTNKSAEVNVEIETDELVEEAMKVVKTIDNAAKALIHQFTSISEGKDNYPLFSALFSVAPIDKRKIDNFDANSFAVVIPEVTMAMSGVLPEDSQVRKKVENVHWQKHGLMRVGGEVFKKSTMEAMRYDLPLLLIRLRDVIPEDGMEIKKNYKEIRNNFKQ